MSQSHDFGRGYDSGQTGLLKAVATAELLGRNRERAEIVELLEQFFERETTNQKPNDEWDKGFMSAVDIIKSTLKGEK